MKLSLIRDNDLQQLLSQNIGCDSSAPDNLIIELLRSELAARGVSGRRSLCDRVIMLLESTAPVNRDCVNENLLALEKAGDINGGPNGQIAVTPLRAVKLAKNKYQLFGTVPQQQLVTLFAKSRLSVGLSRVLSLKGDDCEGFKDLLSDIGGLELSPERWAGMDKISSADQSWLDGLNNRLIMQPGPAGSFDQETRDEWKVYLSDKTKLLQKARWQKNDKGSKGNLWRIWHERGWPMYCWTAGDSPELAEQIRLSNDEANRTMFALDRIKDAGISCKVTEKKSKTQIQIGGFLPNAEYRYLTTKGQFTGKDGDYFCFQFKTVIWHEVLELINERLGIPG